MSRLVCVSNRCSAPRRGAAPGGLAVALTAALRQSGGVWFGWDGSVTENVRRRPSETEVGGVRYATVPLRKVDYEYYYKGYSNRVLWPLCHYRIDAMEYRPEYFEGYLRTNEFLARQLLGILADDDLIWIHDYHLIPLGRSLREAGVSAPLGFFYHIPFPPFDVLRTMPGATDLLWAFRAYNLIGFQSDNDTRNFLDCIARGTGVRVAEDGTINWGERQSCAQTFPIGIDPHDVRSMANSGRNTPTVRRLKTSLQDRSMMIGVDRLDYSKGLPERFNAFRHLLVKYPETIGRVVLLQVAQPSREDVPEYNDIRLALERTVGEINGHYAEFDWVPIRYLNKSYARQTVINFLALAKVGLITPLRDGMNLVAQEYLAAQNPDDPGVLVLSDFTGAARRLDSVLKVNPHDIDAVSDTIQIALNMSREERIHRWRSAMEVIEKQDIHWWAERFLTRLGAT
ncbi:MAG: trehalose-6-phosphate synthase [Pseudomonadota bacterium]